MNTLCSRAKTKQHKIHVGVHLTDRSSWVVHVLTVCCFNAVSIGSSSTTMGLTKRSVLRLKPLYFLFDGLNQKHFFFVLFVVPSI